MTTDLVERLGPPIFKSGAPFGVTARVYAIRDASTIGGGS